jgi:hypothetical protein
MEGNCGQYMDPLTSDDLTMRSSEPRAVPMLSVDRFIESLLARAVADLESR